MTSTIAGIPVKDVSEQDDFLKGLIYGVQGIGKTRLVSTIAQTPEMHPVLWIDTERGTRSIRDQVGIRVVRVKTEFNTQGVIKRPAWNQMQDIYEQLRIKLDYKSIVIDNLTEAESQSMEHTMNALKKVRPERVDPENPTSGPDRREWGQSSEKVTKMIRAYRDFDCHVIFTAHAKDITNDAGAVTATVPDIPGKLAYKVAGFLDFVAYLTTKRGQGDKLDRVLLTKESTRYIVKDRSDNLPREMINPSMQDILKVYLEGLKANA